MTDLISKFFENLIAWPTCTGPPNQFRRNQWDGKITSRLFWKSPRRLVRFPNQLTTRRLAMHNNSFARCLVSNSIMLGVSNQIKWAHHWTSQHETLRLYQWISNSYIQKARNRVPRWPQFFLWIFHQILGWERKTAQFGRENYDLLTFVAKLWVLLFTRFCHEIFVARFAHFFRQILMS